jgi:hypothetical protein
VFTYKSLIIIHFYFLDQNDNRLVICICVNRFIYYGDKIIKLFYFPLIIMVALLLSGCATLQLASFGISGISYAVSGKSISDHAISKVMAKDCALHRVILGQSACVDPELQEPGVLIADNSQSTRSNTLASTQRHWYRATNNSGRNASLSPINHPQGQAKRNVYSKTNTSNASGRYLARKGNRAKRGFQPKESYQPKEGFQAKQRFQRRSKFSSTVSPDELVSAIPATTKIKGGKTADRLATMSHIDKVEARFMGSVSRVAQHNAAKPLLFAVIGSFNELAYARQRIAQYHDLNAQLITSKKGSTKYRVIIGPLTEQQFNHNIGRSTKADLAHAWRLRLCGNTMSPPPCDGAMLANN